jgi:hypothetical protein
MGLGVFPGVGSLGRCGPFDQNALSLDPFSKIAHPVLLTVFPLAELQVFPIPAGGGTVAAGDANIIEFDMKFAFHLSLQNPAVGHFHVITAFGAKDRFRVFDEFQLGTPEWIFSTASEGSAQRLSA